MVKFLKQFAALPVMETGGRAFHHLSCATRRIAQTLAAAPELYFQRGVACK
jgi:hypothetical protein